MLLIRGQVAETTLTGALYEPGEPAPTFRGAPDEGSPFTWVCDDIYEVESGGHVQQVGDREVQVAFEEPLARGFENRDAAIAVATDHVRTQFARLGVDPETVDIELVEPTADESVTHR